MKFIYDGQTVIPLDGRFRISRCLEEAKNINKKDPTKFNYVQVFEGQNFITSKKVTEKLDIKSIMI